MVNAAAGMIFFSRFGSSMLVSCIVQNVAALKMATPTIRGVNRLARLNLNVGVDCRAARYSTEATFGHLDDKTTKWYHISGAGKGTIVSSRTDNGHELSSDVPKKMGGTNRHPQPVEHLLAALVGCEQVTALYVGRSMSPKIFIDRMEFDIKANRDERGALQQPIDEIPKIPARLQQISGVVTVFAKGGRSLSREELELLKHQTEARRPVANMMIASGCDMLVEWKDGNITE